MEDFRPTIDIWIDALENYDFSTLCIKPSAQGWSLGQLYLHLIEDSNYYIEQIKQCLQSNEHLSEEASPFAKTLFLNNEFPDEKIEGAPSNAFIPKPKSKNELMNAFLLLRQIMEALEPLIEERQLNGKTQHPGLGYFNASEWFRFCIIHLRHHLRQKKRLDDFLDQYE